MRRAGVWMVVSFLALVPALVAAPVAGVAGAEPAPRALSAAERAGVELAAAYLQSGPQAWWERLAARAPLRRLGREIALRPARCERCGVAPGTPCGGDDSLEDPQSLPRVEKIIDARRETLGREEDFLDRG